MYLSMSVCVKCLNASVAQRLNRQTSWRPVHKVSVAAILATLVRRMRAVATKSRNYDNFALPKIHGNFEQMLLLLPFGLLVGSLLLSQRSNWGSLKKRFFCPLTQEEERCRWSSKWCNMSSGWTGNYVYLFEIENKTKCLNLSCFCFSQWL